MWDNTKLLDETTYKLMVESWTLWYTAWRAYSHKCNACGFSMRQVMQREAYTIYAWRHPIKARIYRLFHWYKGR